MMKTEINKNNALELSAPASDVLRQLLIRKITAVTRAEVAMRAGEEEGLHQFRVALRRLRSSLKGYRREFDPGLKIRNQLKRLADGTNPARDLEVLVVWIESQRDGSSLPERLINNVIADLRGQSATSDPAVVDYPVVAKRWQKTSARLINRLSRLQPKPGRGFDVVSCRLIRRLGAELEGQLQQTRGPQGVAAAHAARILGKRLRYTLEPLEEQIPPAQRVVELLARLQDELGTINDRAVFVERLGRRYMQLKESEATWRLRRAMAADDADVAVGDFDVDPSVTLLRLIERAAAEQSSLFQQFDAEWPTGITELKNATEQVVAFLATGGRPQ